MRMKKAKPISNGTQKVNEFMDRLEHPLKSEVQMIREIIKKVNKEITEKINWNIGYVTRIAVRTIGSL